MWFELPLLLLVAFCAAVLLRTFVVQSFDIPSGSMQNTLQIGDRVVVNKLIYQLRPPQRGEVVVFRGTDRWASELEEQPDPGLLASTGRVFGDLIGIAAPNEKDLIKRVIGVGGDTVACCDAEGRVTVNGVPLDESGYVYDDAPLDEEADEQCRSRRFGPVEVPAGHLFVMGDHRGDSRDSRCQGFVPVENLIGRAVNVVWPLSNWSSLRAPAVFAGVQAASPGAADPEMAIAPGSGPVATLGTVAPLLLPLPLRRRKRKPPCRR